ncbi:hypothetical protein BGY98DRAFT_932461 [Russula aff. rugulosa BPL654]|nr:hypothetical protein BGY98DRAFT_932461 [Russula aff. rugulosa BPL654]
MPVWKRRESGPYKFFSQMSSGVRVIRGRRHLMRVTRRRGFGNKETYTIGSHITLLRAISPLSGALVLTPSFPPRHGKGDELCHSASRDLYSILENVYDVSKSRHGIEEAFLPSPVLHFMWTTKSRLQLGTLPSNTPNLVTGERGEKNTSQRRASHQLPYLQLLAGTQAQADSLHWRFPPPKEPFRLCYPGGGASKDAQSTDAGDSQQEGQGPPPGPNSRATISSSAKGPGLAAAHADTTCHLRTKPSRDVFDQILRTLSGRTVQKGPLARSQFQTGTRTFGVFYLRGRSVSTQ